MRVKTSHGNITTTEKMLYLTCYAFQAAALYERQSGHLKNHEEFSTIARELKEGLKNDGN